MTDPATMNAYLRTRVMTASPEELRLLLLEGALRFANQAKAGLESDDYEASYAGFTQCRDIVLELITSVRPEHDPDLVERVRSLYTFMYSELVAASFERDIPRLEKVIELLEYERETWVLLMDQVARERAVQEPKPASDTGHAPLSLEA